MIMELVAGFLSAIGIAQDVSTPTIPASYWRNKPMIDLDKRICSHDIFMRNVASGKYYLPDVPPDAVIDDVERYEKDKTHYDFYTVYLKAQNGDYTKKGE